MTRKQNGRDRSGFDRRTVLKTIGAAGVGATTIGTAGVASAANNCDRIVDPNDPQNYDTIQAAVDDATAGEQICVTPGTYDEQVVIEKEIELRGSGNPKNVVVDGGSGIRETIDVNGAPDVTIDGFTVKNTGGSGTSRESYGVRVTDQSDNFTLRDSIVRGINEEARATGLAIDAQPGPLGEGDPSEVTISGVEVHNCRFENIYTTDPAPSGPFDKTKAKGIGCNGDVTGAKITWTTITNIGETGAGRNSSFGRGVSLTEDGNDVGPSDFEIRLSEFSNMDGTFGNPFDGAALFVGEYPDFGDHVVEDNNILVAVENFPNGDPPQSGNDVLEAPNNYWGASDGPNVVGGAGGNGSNVTKNVNFTPFRQRSVNNAGTNV